jgi:hypothetical protein
MQCSQDVFGRGEQFLGRATKQLLAAMIEAASVLAKQQTVGKYE